MTKPAAKPRSNPASAVKAATGKPATAPASVAPAQKARRPIATAAASSAPKSAAGGKTAAAGAATRPAAKPASKGAAARVTKPAAKPVVKPAANAVVKPAARPATKLAVPPAVTARLTLSSRNYSSWSLRGYLMTRFAGLAVEEVMVAPDDPDRRAELLLLSPSILVPILEHEGLKIWDVLAIGEYLAERFPAAGLLPAFGVNHASMTNAAPTGFFSRT